VEVRESRAYFGQRRLSSFKSAPPELHGLQIADGSYRLDVWEYLRACAAHEQAPCVAACELIERDRGSCGGAQFGDQSGLHDGQGLTVGSVEELDQPNDARQPDRLGALVKERGYLDGYEEAAVDDQPAAFDVEVSRGRPYVPE
jgi:hypothetical protein